jgi:Uma2 family endonuclease
MSDMATAIEETVHVPLRRISVDQYRRMGEAGVFDPGERVELLDGVLIAMPPIGPRHAYSVRVLSNLLAQRLGQRAIVDVQSPLTLGPTSQPQPDVMVLQRPHARYARRLPVATDALLVIEVAQRSRVFDRGAKLSAYARSGIAEVWIVDIVSDSVEVFRDPHDGVYGRRTVIQRGGLLVPFAFPDVAIAVDEVLPPRQRG